VHELGSPRKKHFAENAVESRHTLAAGILEIPGIERSEVRRCAKMPSVEKHRVEQAFQGNSEPQAERRRNTQNLLGLANVAIAPQAQGLIQIDTEHGIRSLKLVKNAQVGTGFVAR
jgi:hypothetical protein